MKWIKLLPTWKKGMFIIYGRGGDGGDEPEGGGGGGG